MALEPTVSEQAGSTLSLADAGPNTLPLAELRIDPDLQCRASGVSKATVKEYAEAMKAGARFPAVVVFRDTKGVHWLADGFHRVAAAALIEATEIEIDLREGSRKEAQLHAAGANSSHGLKRTNADRRKAVAMLFADPTWSKRSDGWIAKAANVSQPFVSKMRATQTVMSDGPRETADGRVMDTSRIGKASAPEQTTTEKLTARIEAAITMWPDHEHEALRKLLTQWTDALTPGAAS